MQQNHKYSKKNKIYILVKVYGKVQKKFYETFHFHFDFTLQQDLQGIKLIVVIATRTLHRYRLKHLEGWERAE